MIATSAPQLQPLSMGQLLDRGIRLYRQNFWTFIGIVAAAQIPTAAFSILIAFVSSPRSSVLQDDPFQSLLIDPPAWVGFTTFFLAILGFILTIVANAAITQAAAHSNLGQKLSIGQAFSKIKGSWLSLLITTILAGLLMMAMVIYSIIPLLGWFTGPGAIIFFITVVVPLTIPIVVLERQGGRAALYRGWELGRRRFWWLLGFALLLGLFSLLILQGPILLMTVILSEFSGLGLLSTESQIIQQVVSSILNIIYLPLQLSCYTLMYFDVRIRSEGMDLQLAAVSDEPETAVSISDFLASAPRTTRDWMPSGQIWGWLVGLSFIVFALYGILIGIAFIIASALAPGF